MTFEARIIVSDSALSTVSSFKNMLPRCISGKESLCSTGDVGSVPGSERSPGEEHGNPLQYHCLENPMGRGAW